MQTYLKTKFDDMEKTFQNSVQIGKEEPKVSKVLGAYTRAYI